MVRAPLTNEDAQHDAPERHCCLLERPKYEARTWNALEVQEQAAEAVLDLHQQHLALALAGLRLQLASSLGC